MEDRPIGLLSPKLVLVQKYISFFYDVFAFRGKCSLCHSGLKYIHTNVKAKYFSGAMLIYTSWSSGKFLKALL